MIQVSPRTRKASVNFKDNLSETSAESGDLVDRQEICEGEPNNRCHHGFNTKAKSSLCRNFMEKGVCPYGNKCQFAHGPSELKCNSDQQMSYKTRPCHAFNRKGFCSYGSRCNFLHQNEDEAAQVETLKLREVLY